ncbi:MAG TPA: efflux RND transporter periplasmic adaptor subunit [Ramlibacter sp.]|uniref:efflux RND transporter periplasmic adaptor subunit n=1 Tax=Ramlibacter sp. TaxID=1917967 RepID=UPI002C7BC87E|nr:efflux RND transporter periplasmic adaptor subunit [Ramlibacter sp.]HVZ44892.1 efflux RND transporter periplasmic adaptor subunit [Ramlibacter sp.]
MIPPIHIPARARAWFALAGCTVLTACAPAKSADGPPAPPQVAVVTVHRTSVPMSVELPGRTSPYLVAQVRARVDGIVQRREFTEGSDVKAGQPLYQVDPAPYAAALDSARAALQRAQANLASTTALAQRDRMLIDANAVSRQDYDNAVAAQRQAAADVATAQAQVRTAQINLDYTRVTSPIDGRSGLSQVTQGAYVQAGAATLLTTVQQIDPIYVDISQPSVAAGRIKAAAPSKSKVTLSLDDGTAYPLPGTLEFSDISVNAATGSVTMRALFPNPNFALLPGMFVRAHVDEGTLDNVVLVPQVGVTHNPQGEATAMVVGSDNRVALRTLRVRGTQGDQWVAEAGLADGDRVIIAGSQKVRPGTLVKTTN